MSKCPKNVPASQRDFLVEILTTAAQHAAVASALMRGDPLQVVAIDAADKLQALVHEIKNPQRKTTIRAALKAFLKKIDHRSKAHGGQG